MKFNFSIIHYSMLLGAGLFFGGCEKDQLLEPSDKQSLETRSSSPGNGTKRIAFYGLSSANEIVRFTSGNTAVDQGAVGITGLQADEQILAIDFRPSTGQLYGVPHRAVYMPSIQIRVKQTHCRQLPLVQRSMEA